MNRRVAFTALLSCLACAMVAHDVKGFDWSSLNGDSVFTENRDAIMAYAERHGVPSTPKVAFINIDDFPETRDALGIDPEDEGPFAMLTEDYTFYDLDGAATTIPKGFIFDGASFPKETWKKFFINGVVGVHGSSFDPTVLAAGLIHDYMYRNPGNNPLYTQEYADMMIAVNAALSGNKSAWEIWAGLRAPRIVGGGVVAYSEHQRRRASGDYARFTGEYYAREYDRYVEMREGWTSDQLFHRGGPTMSDETRRLFTGEGATGGGNDGGGMVCYPGDGTGDGSSGELLPTPSDSSVTIAVAGPCIPYRRLLYLFSGDFPGASDFKDVFKSASDIFTGDSPLKDDLGEYQKMWKSMQETKENLGGYEKMWESTKTAWDVLRK